MNRITSLHSVITFVAAIVLIVTGGCSSRQSTPVTSNIDISDMSLSVNDQSVDDTTHQLLGTWTINFDTETLSATITPDRTLNTHWNVKSFLPAPSIVITGYNPSTEVVEVDLTITNPYPVNVYDVRLIIFTDSTGKRLMNADNWTALYDFPGGLPVNPFKAYAIDDDARTFEGHSEHTMNLSIHIPGGNASVKFAIDAAYPGNCEEPYQIYWSNLLDKLLDQTGSSALIEVLVDDHQYDANSAELYCPAITGEILVPFYQDGNTWKMELVNATGAPAGEYPGWVLAKSAGSGSITLYEPVTIRVYPAGDYPYNPEVIGKYDPFYYAAYNVCVQGEYAYVVDGSGDRAILKIVNISDPANPIPMGFVDYIPGDYLLMDVRDIKVQGDYVYAVAYIYANGFGYKWALIVIDVSDPWNPVLVGECQVETDYYYTLAVKGEWIYLGGMYDIIIIDALDPTNPQIVGEIENTHAEDMDIQGDYLYAIDFNHLFIVDISLPYSPQLIKEFITGVFLTRSISVNGDYAFIVQNGSSYKVMNISDPANPYEVANGDNNLKGWRVDLVGDYAYVACRDDGFKIVDISDPYHPAIIGSFETTSALDVQVIATNAFLADNTGGLRIIDVTNPESPSQTGRLKTANPSNVCVNGNYAYVADGEYGYTILDISDKESPQNLVSCDTPITTDIKVRDNYAYIIGRNLTGNDCLFVMDFSDPFNPVEIGSLNAGPGVILENLLINATYAYVCAGTRGLIIVDISVPSSPGPVYWVNIPDARDVAIEGDYAYVASYEDGLYVVNISDPTNPQIAGSTLTLDNVRSVAVKGDYAYVIDRGLSVVNISQPDAPQYITNTGYLPAWGITVSGDYVYIAGEGLTVFDITNPSNPEIFSTVIDGLNNVDVQVNDKYAYLVAGNDGLKIIELWQ